MARATGGNSKEMAGAHAKPGAVLLALISVNLALGVVFSLFLLGLPSDPENALVGRYSAGRVLLVGGIVAATIAFAIMGLTVGRNRGWRTSLGERLFGRAGWVRPSLPFAGLALMSLSLAPLLFFPEQLDGLTKYHYIRMAPYLLWPWALLASLALVPWIVETRPRVHVSSTAAEGIAAIGLFLISFSARAPLTGYALPYQSVWDEVVTYPRALELLSGKPILEAGTVPGYGRASYGDPLTYVTAAGQMAGLFATLRSGQAIGIDSYLGPADGVGTVFEAVHESGVPLQYPRLLFALIGSICPVLIYVALRRYFGGSVWISLAGGVILAVLTPQVVYYSSFIMPDSLATTLAMGAVLAGMEVIRSQGASRISEVACATLAGVAVSVSMRYVGLIPMPFLALALSGSRQKWGARVGLIAAGLALGFVATSPTLLVDLPGYLGRLAGFSWFGDDSLPNRMVSLSFYLRGAFLGPARLGIEQAEGEGLGLIVLGLFLVGYVVALQGQRKPTVFLTLVALFHLLVITPTRYRYERHALVLYPLLAIFAAVGLGFAQQRLASALGGLRRKAPSRWLPAGAISAASGFIILLLFLVASTPKMLQTARLVEAMRSFKPSQLRIAEYVRANLEEDARIGLLEVVPFADAQLQSSGADIHRVGLNVTIEELRQDGIEYVIGTDAIGSAFGDSWGTIWVSDLISDEERLVEFGTTDLVSRGYPVGDLTLYLSRVPPLGPEP